MSAIFHTKELNPMSEGQLKLEPRALVSRAEFARMMNVTRGAVTRAIDVDRLRGPALGPNKKLVLPFAAVQWRQNRSGEDGAAVARAEDGYDEEIGSLEAIEADNSGLPAEPGSIRFEKARSLRLKNERLEREMEAEAGTLVSTAEVGHALATAGGAIAQDLENISSWAEEIAALPCGDVPQIRAFLKSKVRALRDNIAARLSMLSLDPSAGEDTTEEDNEA